MKYFYMKLEVHLVLKHTLIERLPYFFQKFGASYYSAPFHQNTS